MKEDVNGYLTAELHSPAMTKQENQSGLVEQEKPRSKRKKSWK